ncbi:sister chromatid cohesion protein DCC1-like [Littorina saxatilis]|uniref:Sister chromatid cohesion protein DCC1 n=1 Tax=Littorina saxatilis TaxID=31220 RepID=A0AAN9G904_9CAEN
MAGEMDTVDSSIKTSPKRSQEDVNTVLKYAKLETSDVRPCVQTIFFSENLENDTVKLLELDATVLDALQAGDRVTLRGDKDDHAVLCTKNQTFDMKDAELSNSMLLLRHLDYGPDLPDSGPQEMRKREVFSVVHEYYELRPVKPKLRVLRQMLNENQYSGRECEEDDQHTGKKYTMSDFLNVVQASEEEIVAGLKRLKALEIEGKWRVLDFDFMSTVMSNIVHLAEERDWISTGVALHECLEVLQDLFLREVIIHVLKYYSIQTSDTNEDSDVYLFDEDKVCQFYAEVCLRNSGKFNLSEFLQVWDESVPMGMKTSLTQIQGMALVDRDSNPETISFFPADNLPEDVSGRFDYLFDTRKKWTLDEISPYVSDLTTPKMDVGALLTKYSRASVQNGIKVFSSRRTIS